MNDCDHTGTVVNDGFALTYLRLPRQRKTRPCRWYRRHRWTDWADPMRYYGSGWYQRRTCRTCNKVGERIL